MWHCEVPYGAELQASPQVWHRHVLRCGRTPAKQGPIHAVQFSSPVSRNPGFASWMLGVVGPSHAAQAVDGALGSRRTRGRRHTVFRVFKRAWIPLLLVVVVALGAYAVVRIRDSLA